MSLRNPLITSKIRVGKNALTPELSLRSRLTALSCLLCMVGFSVLTSCDHPALDPVEDEDNLQTRTDSVSSDSIFSVVLDLDNVEGGDPSLAW